MKRTLKSVYSLVKKSSKKDKDVGMTREEETKFLAKFKKGRVVPIEGKVIRGNGLGKTVGFPTANLEWDKKKLETGCYLCDISLTRGRERISESGILIMEAELEKASVHVLDFSGDIYDWDLSATPTKEVSGIVLENLQEISSQIRKK